MKKRIDCDHGNSFCSVSMDACVMCELMDAQSELNQYKKVVGLLKMSELIALAEKAGMTVQVSIVKNGKPE